MFKRYQPLLHHALLFILFLAASLPAFFTALNWMNRQVVFWEAFTWFIITVISIGILAAFKALGQVPGFLRQNWAILPFLAYAACSIIWSVDREISFFRWLVLVGVVSASVVASLFINWERFTGGISVYAIYILLASSLLVVFAPGVGVQNYHTIQGAWKGIFWHKNHMGLMASFFNLLFLLNAIRCLQKRSGWFWLWLPLYLFSIYFILQTDSAAAMITMLGMHGLVGAAVLWLKFRARLQPIHYLAVAVLALIAITLALLNIDFVLGVFNRNRTLTGRIPMWAHLFNTYLSARPFQGYGFNAFWYIEPFRIDLQHAASYPGQIVIADNGFIDILINTGWCGLALFQLFYLATWWRAGRIALRAMDLLGLLPLLLMGFTLLANISWSLIFENEGFFMLLMLMLYFSLNPMTTRGVAENP